MAAVAVVGAVAASAGALGAVDTKAFGDKTTGTTSCTSDAHLHFGGAQYNGTGTGGNYNQVTVKVDHLSKSCNGSDIQVSLIDGSGHVLSQADGTVTSGSFTGTTTKPFDLSRVATTSLDFEAV